MDYPQPFSLPIATTRSKLPNVFPSVDFKGRRIAFIDLCPTDEDIKLNKSFSCKAHSMLRDIINSLGHSSLGCFFGYLSSSKLISRSIPHGDPDFAIDRSQLRRDLLAYKPNIIVLFTEQLLSLAGKHGFSVNEFRGSLFVCSDPNSPFFGFKCLCTIHPFDVFISYDNLPVLNADVSRALQESISSELDLPSRVYDVTLNFINTLNRINAIQPNSYISLDIEGTVETGITCLSIADSPYYAFIVPFDLFSDEETAQLILALRTKLFDPSIAVILQNGLYDAFCLLWCFKVLIRNIAFDTMLSSWEIMPELPKALGFQASLWTREPAYKYQRKIDDKLTHYKYCCTDSCVTFEIAERHYSAMTPLQREHFSFNMQMLPLLLYGEIRGINYDVNEASDRLKVIEHNLSEIQTRINTRAGKAINLESPKQLTKFLYVDQALPAQHPKKKDGRGYDKTKLTADVDALLELSGKHPHPVITEILLFRKLTKIAQALRMGYDTDNRMRCSYNVVGTKTGRLSCSKSPTGRGGNLQTVTKKLRVLYKADPDHYFYQVDLSGADGWTVAAHTKALGDPTMMDDYLYGIKPARVIGLMFLEGAEVSMMNREELKRACKKIGEGDTEWLYFSSKCVQHGTNYLLGLSTMQDLIRKNSYKIMGTPINVDRKTCEKLQNLYKLRYKGVKTWQSFVETQIKHTGCLPSAAGHIHPFLGRRSDSKTHREACAFEPQINTTYVTNRALLKIWLDPRNRRDDGSLIVEPLHQIHDAGCGQFPIDQVAFAVPFIKECFHNPITIANQEIIIPFEGGYGTDWYNLPYEI